MCGRSGIRQPFLIHHPYSETPGVVYGMLMALFLNDPPTLNRWMEGSENTMYYDWRVDGVGGGHRCRTRHYRGVTPCATTCE
jgi:hypothetical protein